MRFNEIIRKKGRTYMKKSMKVTAAVMALFTAFAMAGCGNSENTEGQTVKSAGAEKQYENATVIELNEDTASIDGNVLEESDYTWHCNPSEIHTDADDAPAEYYTGTKLDTSACAYIDHELYYYPSLSAEGFKQIDYDGEKEWAYYYTDGENDKYIFATLPVAGDEVPENMMHTETEAAENKVLHIKQPGEYILRGKWQGQISVDLGEDAFENEESKVTLILDGADIRCTVAPGIVFESVYECDGSWEERTAYSEKTDTENAGANIIMADGSENYVLGTNVYRMLKTKYKDNSDILQKKMRKTDGAIYSYMSMNIGGKGSITVDSGYEGIDSELHLTVNDGNITVNSQNDGMNVNEDGVSVISFNGGTVTLNAGLGTEGDGVDSNGFIVINGGTVYANGIKAPDSAFDSDCGTFYLSGKIYVDGKEQQYQEGVVSAGPEMGDKPDGQMPGNADFDIKEFKKKVAELPDDATYEDVMGILGMNQTPPQDGQPPEKPEM